MIRAAVVDSERVVVRVVLRRIDGAPLPPAYADLVYMEFAGRFELPRPMQLPVFSAGPALLHTLRAEQPPGGAPRLPLVQGAYRFVLRRDGGSGRPVVTLASLIPGLDSAVLRAIAGAGGERSFPHLPEDELLEDSLSMELRLTTSPIHTGRPYDLVASWFPKLPVVDAVLVESPPPRFPDEERTANIRGDVLFQVVVAPEGEPYASTVQLMQATTRGFVQSAIEALAEMRWTPATVAGCPVPQLVHVSIPFRPQ